MRRRKTYRKRYDKKQKTFGREKKLSYARKGCIFLRSGFPNGALISAATSFLGSELFRKTF